MEYLNARLLGLSGKPHPILSNITDSRDVPKLRIHLKFLTGDLLNYDRISQEHGTSPHCRLCPAPRETTQHILTECRATSDVRDRLHADLVNLVADIDPCSTILQPGVPANIFTQFIIDPTSMNLPNGYRISLSHPRLPDLFRISRDWCFALNSRRTKLLKNLPKAFTNWHPSKT